MAHATKEIAEIFKNYYEALYSVNQKADHENGKTDKINDFL